MNSQDPPLDLLRPIINFYTNGNLQQALDKSIEMLEKFPNSITLFNISGSYKGIIFCSGLKQAQLIANHLNSIIKMSNAPGLTSSIRRGCSKYSISYPDYKEINESDPQLMNFNND